MQKVPDPRSGGEVTYGLRMLARVWISLGWYWSADSRVTPHVQTSEAGAHRVWDGTILVANESTSKAKAAVLSRNKPSIRPSACGLGFMLGLFRIFLYFYARFVKPDNSSSSICNILLIPKTIGNRKRDCAWRCAWGINTTWENLQIEKHK